ncbi:MAG: S-layer homology domain-containing protein, partial [Oscillibacter sp.]|nr:S-layer homology domain-containing protein [Oscillibacter sp.]
MKRNRRIPVSLLSWMAAALLLTGRAAAASPGAAVPETESIAEAEQTAQTAPADTPESVGSSLPESGDTGEENPDEEEAELQGLFGWKSRPRLTVSLDGWRVGQAPNLPAVTGNAEDAPVLFVYRDAEGTIVPDIASAPAGEYTVTAFLEESEDYTAASARADFSITPAYMVTWRNADGTVLEIDKNVEPGALPHYDGPAPEKAGTAAYTYTFQGWDPAVTESGTVTGDTVFTAVFSSSLNRYPVDFLDDDGTVLRHAVYDYGTRAEDIVRPSAPVKGLTGEYAYTFQNWTPEIADVTGSAAYTAVYRRTPVQIYHPAESTRSYYSTLVEPCEGGTVQALPSESRPGTPVLLSVSPEDGYALDVLIVRGLGRVETLGLTAAGENRTFVMPAFDVSVTASFRKLDTADTGRLDTDTGETEETRTAGAETAAAQLARENGTESAVQEPAEAAAVETMQNTAQSAGNSAEKQEAPVVEQYALVRTGFSDVSGGAYYARAVKWAEETGVLPGVSETAFAPDRPCTRAQM